MTEEQQNRFRDLAVKEAIQTITTRELREFNRLQRILTQRVRCPNGYLGSRLEEARSRGEAKNDALNQASGGIDLRR